MEFNQPFDVHCFCFYPSLCLHPPFLLFTLPSLSTSLSLSLSLHLSFSLSFPLSLSLSLSLSLHLRRRLDEAAVTTGTTSTGLSRLTSLVAQRCVCVCVYVCVCVCVCVCFIMYVCNQVARESISTSRVSERA